MQFVEFKSNLDRYEYQLAEATYFAKHDALTDVMESKHYGNKEMLKQRRFKRAKIECLRKAIRNKNLGT